jgi:hypothetical protein
MDDFYRPVAGSNLRMGCFPLSVSALPFTLNPSPLIFIFSVIRFPLSFTFILSPCTLRLYLHPALYSSTFGFLL